MGQKAEVDDSDITPTLCRPRLKYEIYLGRISYSPQWSWTPCIAQVDLELPILLKLLQNIDKIMPPCPAYVGFKQKLLRHF